MTGESGASVAEGSVTLAELLRGARGRLAAGGVASPAIDARALIEGLLGFDAKDMILGEEARIGAADRERLDEALLRRLGGEPVHRILGRRSFFGLELRLSPATLEPRPDTEVLVEALIPFVEETAAKSGRCRIADLGTGTGAIGLALLSVCEAAHCVGVDRSGEALRTAAENARSLGLDGRFATVESDWFDAVRGEFDVIVSNPPYIETPAIESLARDVRDHDPRAALDGGPDGLDAYRAIARGAGRHLAGGGMLGVEHGFGQAGAVEAIFRGAGFTALSRHADLAGLERACLFSTAAR